jgi:hypothetical protein
MEFEIREIKIKKNSANIHLSLNGELIPLYKPLWKNEKMYPAVFLMNETPYAALEVTIHILDGALEGEYEYILKTHHDEKPVFSGKPIRILPEKKNIIFEVYPQFKAGDVFLISGNILSWNLFRNNKPISKHPQSVDLELYWLHGEDYILFKRGVPVEILREMAKSFKLQNHIALVQFDTQRETVKLTSSQHKKKTRDWLIDAAVLCCFFYNPPCYDICNPTSRYTKRPCGYDYIIFQLMKYLRAKNIPSSTCNCEDQAAALQVFMKAVGISDVWFSYLPKDLYLKLTYLVGRGLSNNPKYANPANGGLYKKLKCVEGCNPIIAQKDKYRTSFNYHTFCCLGKEKNSDEHKVLDACVGPHTGNEDHQEYICNVADPVNPMEIKPPDPKAIEHYDGVTSIDWIPECKACPESPLTNTFKEKMCLTDEHIKKSVDRFVVCSWPDPRECPPLAKDVWELRFEDIIPGNNAVLKSWVLYKDGMSIDIELYISSRRDTSAMFRFLEIGSNTNLSELPYKKGPRWLGQHSAMSITCSHMQYFWIYHNVVFNITCHNVEKKKVKNLIKWQYEFKKLHIKENIDEFLPSVDDITCLHTTPQKSKTVTVNMKHQENILHDFTFSKDDKNESDGLRLIDETDVSLVFEAVKKSNNKLLVVAVDKNTLLVNKKEFTIQVTNT